MGPTPVRDDPRHKARKSEDQAKSVVFPVTPCYQRFVTYAAGSETIFMKTVGITTTDVLTVSGIKKFITLRVNGGRLVQNNVEYGRSIKCSMTYDSAPVITSSLSQSSLDKILCSEAGAMDHFGTRPG